MDHTFVIDVNRMSETRQGHVVFTCHGATTKAQAVAMVNDYIRDVRDEHKKFIMSSGYWGLVTDPMPVLEEISSSDYVINVIWSIDGARPTNRLRRSDADCHVDLHAS